MKRPFESMTELVSNNLERVRENQLHNFANSDKYMVWVVGFSIGGISIILSNLTSFNDTFNHGVLKTVLVALCVSIVSGLIYRWSFYKLQYHYQQIEFYLKGAYAKRQMMEIEPYDLSTEEDIIAIITALKVDYDLDYQFVLETYNQYDEENRAIIRNNLKNIYNNFGEQIKKEYNFAKDYIIDVQATAFDVSKDKVQKHMNRNSGKYLKIHSRITTTTFILSCLSFIFVLVYLTILY